MKYICLYITVLFGRVIDTLKPIYKSITENTHSIIRTLSGVYTPNKPPCNIIPGYMEHDPKTESKKHR